MKGIRWTTGRIVTAAAAFLAAAASITYAALKPAREITCRSGEAYALYLEGIEAQKKIYYPEARAAWNRALAIDSTCAMASIRLGMMAYSHGNVEEAATRLAHARSQVDRLNDKERLFVKLFEADMRDDDKARDAIVTQLVTEFPDDAEILFIAGNRAFHAKKHEEALNCFQKLIAKAPERGEVYNMMGYAFVELARWDEAIEAFQKYAFLYPDDANPHDSLGELYLRTGRYEDALKEFGKALELKPDFGWAHFHAALAYCETRRHHKAFESIDQAIARSPDKQERATWERHSVFFRLMAGDHAAALNRALALKEAAPERPVTWFALGRVHAAAGRDDLAETDLERMFETTKKLVAAQPVANDSASLDNFQLNELRAEIAASRGKWQDADSLYCRALKDADSWFVIRRLQLSRAECLVRSGRAEEAVKLTSEVLKSNPHQPSFRYWRGRALEALGRRVEADQDYRSARETLRVADAGDKLAAAVRASGETVPASPGERKS